MIEVGDEVTSDTPLRCGSGQYPEAVVVCVNPITLSSPEGDMVWYAHEGKLTSVGQASREVLCMVLARIGKELRKS